MNNVFILSAKYAPGHFSHMLAYYNMFKDNSCKCKFLIDKNYESFIEEYPNYEYIYFNKSFDFSNDVDILLIYNQSIYDRKIIKKMRHINPNIKILFVYHEPWLGYKNTILNFISKKESLNDTIRTFGKYVFVKRVLKSCNMVLLPSEKSKEYYVDNCVRFNNNFKIFPLVFTDEKEVNNIDEYENKYFSFISTVQNAKNFDKFVEYIKYKLEHDSNFFAQIVTRSDISNIIDDKLKEYIKENRLIIKQGVDLSNKEINAAFLRSKCIWNVYLRSTQSGVLCKAFMFGTPVIASNIGSFKEIITGENGKIINANASLEEIDKAYNEIEKNYDNYSREARKTFINNFYYKSVEKQFAKILSEVK